METTTDGKMRREAAKGGLGSRTTTDMMKRKDQEPRIQRGASLLSLKSSRQKESGGELNAKDCGSKEAVRKDNVLRCLVRRT